MGKEYNHIAMKDKIIECVKLELQEALTLQQLKLLEGALHRAFADICIEPIDKLSETCNQANLELETSFIAAKRLEGCSEKTLAYYHSTLCQFLNTMRQPIRLMTTGDIREYLASRQAAKNLSKVTMDNIRRIFSSFFSWLEDEDYITKSPVRRIRKVRADSLIKEVLSDEHLEELRDVCLEPRDLAIIDLLASTGIRIGELVRMNRDDMDFRERQCVVFGKGNKEREVYFNARTKIHLQNYLKQRTDNNPALFVSIYKPHKRLSINGIEGRLKKIGRLANVPHVHPHKFRRTLATMAIDKGMPIEQVQRLLGHVRVDTTLHYALVNQNNVKQAHRKYIG